MAAACGPDMYSLICERRFDGIDQAQRTNRAETASEIRDLRLWMEGQFMRMHEIIDGDPQAPGTGIKGRAMLLESRVSDLERRRDEGRQKQQVCSGVLWKIAAGVLIVVLIKIIAGASPLVAQWLAR